ncbi:BREX system ATP-binding domain-containing protein, partial [Klebsiella pneumoniae]
AGYAGLLVSLDEMVNLLKLNNTQARTANYEQILRILNDCLQGSAENIGFILGGTPE